VALHLLSLSDSIKAQYINASSLPLCLNTLNSTLKQSQEFQNKKIIYLAEDEKESLLFIECFSKCLHSFLCTRYPNTDLIMLFHRFNLGEISLDEKECEKYGNDELSLYYELMNKSTNSEWPFKKINSVKLLKEWSYIKSAFGIVELKW